MTPGEWTAEGQSVAVWPGKSYPLGCTWGEESTNFAIYAPEASNVWICLFDQDQNETRYELTERTLGIWHGAIPGVALGATYGVRADGPWEPDLGFRFNADKLLIDPYAKAISGTLIHDQAVFGYNFGSPPDAQTRNELDSAAFMPKCVVTDDRFDWGDDRPARRRWRDTVIYELHVKGFTHLHDRIPEELRGTYAGLGHPTVVEYLHDLGITAVELLPVHQFVDEPALAAQGQVNYWGYNSIGYFAPHGAYAAGGDRGEQVREFKQMVKNLHAAGLEVILDVVYNHTAEAGPLGPTLSFRGLDDRGYYQRVREDHAKPDTYWDVTGCGNTVAAYRPNALRLILDSLRYWVTEMHVDGFRFDLMSAIARTGHSVDMAGHLLTTIGQDPVLRHVKLIAEPWDASMDGYRVGEFPPPWVEWNDQFRDTMRDFWRSHNGGVRTVATRLAGSSDLYLDDGRSPYNSVNFVTAHDGFTLRDLVSYNDKHNHANGEDNRDGTDNNRSWNCGVEGPTNDPDIIALRKRQAANMMLSLCLSNGVPMLVAGDERGRTQGGNNNPYSQDNETSWVDWRADDAWLDLYELTKKALRIRRDHQTLRQRHWFEGRPAIVGGPKDLAWIHPAGREMTPEDWQDDSLHVLGMFVSGDPLRSPGPRGEQLRDSSFLLWLNGSPYDVEVTVPDNPFVVEGHVALSTDPALAEGTPLRGGETWTLPARSLVLLEHP